MKTLSLATGKFNNRTISLAEDEVIIELQERLWLAREGHKVKHITTGEDAIKNLNENSDQTDLIHKEDGKGGTIVFFC